MRRLTVIFIIFSLTSITCVADDKKAEENGGHKEKPPTESTSPTRHDEFKPDKEEKEFLEKNFPLNEEDVNWFAGKLNESDNPTHLAELMGSIPKALNKTDPKNEGNQEGILAELSVDGRGEVFIDKWKKDEKQQEYYRHIFWAAYREVKGTHYDKDPKPSEEWINKYNASKENKEKCGKVYADVTAQIKTDKVDRHSAEKALDDCRFDKSALFRNASSKFNTKTDDRQADAARNLFLSGEVDDKGQVFTNFQVGNNGAKARVLIGYSAGTEHSKADVIQSSYKAISDKFKEGLHQGNFSKGKIDGTDFFMPKEGKLIPKGDNWPPIPTWVETAKKKQAPKPAEKPPTSDPKPDEKPGDSPTAGKPSKDAVTVVLNQKCNTCHEGKNPVMDPSTGLITKNKKPVDKETLRNAFAAGGAMDGQAVDPKAIEAVKKYLGI